ncbi:hypothetical protein B0H14DRAFT_3040727 [Mycena olivaceomarginata]|nr:hypothetical protein B0H14DRAFT_3040727 [Mycena olivaceomarginata]
MPSDGRDGPSGLPSRPRRDPVSHDTWSWPCDSVHGKVREIRDPMGLDVPGVAFNDAPNMNVFAPAPDLERISADHFGCITSACGPDMWPPDDEQSYPVGEIDLHINYQRIADTPHIPPTAAQMTQWNSLDDSQTIHGYLPEADLVSTSASLDAMNTGPAESTPSSERVQSAASLEKVASVESGGPVPHLLPTSAEFGVMKQQAPVINFPGPIPSTIPDRLGNMWSTFLSRLARTHSPVSACHAATEVFVVGEEIITLLATLREDLDFNPNFWIERDVKTDFEAQAIIVAAPCSEQNPTSWLKYQASAGAVQAPRMKSSLWTFGALPVQSHIPESPSFRWLKQTWLSFSTSHGVLNVMNVSSGEETLPLPRAHELRGRLTHPANDCQRLQVHASIDEEYETVIKDDCEDWIIAVFNQLMTAPSEHRQRLLVANMQYMHQTMKIEALAFKQAGHATCPHARISWRCPYQNSTFDLAVEQMWELCLQLINSQTDSVWAHATFPQRWVARKIGELHHKCRHAYGLLSKTEYDQYHSISFPALTNLRSLLGSLPAGTIWNYIDPVVKAQAVCYRLENPCIL